MFANVAVGADAVWNSNFGLQRQAVLPERGRPDVVISTGEEFRLLHVNELDDMAQASPALVGDRLLIRTEQRLYSIRRKT
jgi:hypothetical protein